MTEKIKEILDIFKQVYEDNNNGIKYENFNTGYMNIPTYELYPGDCKLLYDYITNLQQEKDELKEEKEDYEEIFNLMAKFRDKALERNLIYNSRIKKIRNYVNSTDFIYDEQYKKKDKIENILNGSDENDSIINNSDSNIYSD